MVSISVSESRGFFGSNWVVVFNFWVGVGIEVDEVVCVKGTGSVVELCTGLIA